MVRWAGIVVVLAMGAGVYFLITVSGRAQSFPARKGSGPSSRPVSVVAVPAKVANVNVYLDGLGTVVPLNAVTVKSRVDGQLVKVSFREGDMVAEGDLLAEIDPRPFQVQLEQVEGQMAHDQALLQNALIDLDRYRLLLQQDSIAKQVLDTQEALVKQYQGAIRVDQGQIDNARLQLTYARITSPISGRLGLRQVDPGNIIHASDSNGLVVIAQMEPIAVIFTIPEDSLPAVLKKLKAKEQLPVEAFQREGKIRLATGTLLTADNQIDPTTGTIKLKAVFPNKDRALFPNQFVNIRLLLEVKEGATVVPASSIQQGNEGPFLYLVRKDNTIDVRPIVPGVSEGDNVAVTSGVEPGEPVVVDGTDKIRKDAKVQVEIRGSPQDANLPPSKPAGNKEHRFRTGD